MKNIKRIIFGLIITLSSLMFISCGSDNNAKFTKDQIVKIDIVSCNAEASFTEIQSGDILITPSASSIDLRHLSDGSKKVCVLSGSAYLKR